MSTQGNGTVKWYNPEKAYGFITTTAGDDLFVHRNAIADGRPWLIDGQGVTFTIRQGQKGSEAADVRVVQDVEEIPTYRQRLYTDERRTYARSGGGYDADRGYRASGTQPPRRAPYTGAPPQGPVEAKVMRIDPSERFLFAHAEAIGEDIYVHGSLFRGQFVQPGDVVLLVVENSGRGLRARTLHRR
jgi:CspA family cold shock protein